VLGGENLAKSLLICLRDPQTADRKKKEERPMINLSEIKITPRDEQVLKLLVQGCSNKESPPT